LQQLQRLRGQLAQAAESPAHVAALISGDTIATVLTAHDAPRYRLRPSPFS